MLGRLTEHPDKRKWFKKQRRSRGEAEREPGIAVTEAKRGKGFKKRFTTEGARGCSRTVKGPLGLDNRGLGVPKKNIPRGVLGMKSGPEQAPSEEMRECRLLLHILL